MPAQILVFILRPQLPGGNVVLLTELTILKKLVCNLMPHSVRNLFSERRLGPQDGQISGRQSMACCAQICHVRNGMPTIDRAGTPSADQLHRSLDAQEVAMRLNTTEGPLGIPALMLFRDAGILAPCEPVPSHLVLFAEQSDRILGKIGRLVRLGESMDPGTA